MTYDIILYMLDFIDPVYFIVSFAIGILLVYITVPKPDVIIKYPTLENAEKVIYEDDAGVCYKYKVEYTQCPVDKSKISKTNIQHVKNKNEDEDKDKDDDVNKKNNDNNFMDVIKNMLK